jgi:hypothetical protein
MSIFSDDVDIGVEDYAKSLIEIYGRIIGEVDKPSEKEFADFYEKFRDVCKTLDDKTVSMKEALLPERYVIATFLHDLTPSGKERYTIDLNYLSFRYNWEPAEYYRLKAVHSEGKTKIDHNFHPRMNNYKGTNREQFVCPKFLYEIYVNKYEHF